MGSRRPRRFERSLRWRRGWRTCSNTAQDVPIACTLCQASRCILPVACDVHATWAESIIRNSSAVDYSNSSSQRAASSYPVECIEEVRLRSVPVDEIQSVLRPKTASRRCDGCNHRRTRRNADQCHGLQTTSVNCKSRRIVCIHEAAIMRRRRSNGELNKGIISDHQPSTRSASGRSTRL